jgi:hypothetical protein
METKHLPILVVSVLVHQRAIHSVIIVLILCPLRTAAGAGKAKFAIPMALTKFPSKHGLALTLVISLISLALYPTWPLIWV